MVDTLTPPERSRRMALIRSRNTKPEIFVRSLLHRLRYRFRIHQAQLPGRPDIVFPKRRKVVFVHGCFWHQHPGCKIAHLPRSRQEYWAAKFEANCRRDAEHLNLLLAEGWEVCVVWECELKDQARLTGSLIGFLGAPGRSKDKPGAEGEADS